MPIERLIRTGAVLLATGLAIVALGCNQSGDGLASVIDAGGGDAGPTGQGGRGSGFRLAIEEASARDLGIEILRRGGVDASFEVPPRPAPDFGTNPLVVTNEVFVGSLTEFEPTPGSVYMLKGQDSLLVSDGNGTAGDEPPVTGVHVEPGGVLVFPHNEIHGDSRSRVEVTLSHDIVNDGEITTLELANFDRGDLVLSTTGGRYMGRGDVVNHGVRPGQSGGDVWVLVEGDSINEGSWLTYGAESANGGRIIFGASPLDENPDCVLFNTGRFDASGGDAAAGGVADFGGSANEIDLNAGVGVFNSGDMVAVGGDGIQSGGNGGWILFVSARGDIRNAGNLIADAGQGEAQVGGDGGTVFLVARGGELRTSGRLSAQGGAASGDSRGGDGGSIRLGSTATSEAVFPPAPGSSVLVSGDLLIGGGDGLKSGGRGGALLVQVSNPTPGHDVQQRISLRGYSLVDGSGGDGLLAGEGGELTIDTSASGSVLESPVRIDPLVDLSGGDADPGVAGSSGGDGGPLFMRASVLTLGEGIDQSGGTGETPGSEPEA
jgi:hypothetical protein